MGTGVHEWVRRNWWQVVVLTVGGWTGFYFALVLPMHFAYSQTVMAQRSSGLGAVSGYDPIGLWRQSSLWDLFRPSQSSAQRDGSNVAFMMAYTTPGEIPYTGTAAQSRYIVHSAELELEVKSPIESAERIRALAEQMGGYLVSSEIGSAQYATGGRIIVRVPASRFDEMGAELKKIALRAENEKIEATDVTKDYVDKEARLRNLQAEEAQFLSILKHSATVKDTLEVSDKLSEARGQIEQQQAELATLTNQIETASIAVSLHAQAYTQVFGIHWRPLYTLKLAGRDGLDSLASYVAIMIAAIFRLPAFLLWVLTTVLAASIAVRGTRWIWKTFFVKQATSN